MRKIRKILFLVLILFCFKTNVFASPNYLSLESMDELLDQSYTGLVFYNNNYYYLSNGDIVKDDYIVLDDKEYYFNSEGIMQDALEDESTENNDGTTANEATDGEDALVSGENNTSDFNTKKDGVLSSSDEDNALDGQWQQIDGREYYVYSDGSKATGWVVIDGEKCYFNGSGQLIERNALKIIDVSRHQGNIDWETVKGTDVDGAIIRLGYGTSYTTDDPVVDRQWEANYSGANNQDLLFGVYLYSYALDEASANIEADFVIDYLNRKNMDKKHVIYYDLEENAWTTVLTKDDYDIVISTFINRLEAAGYKVYVYTNKNWALVKLSDYARSKLAWVAQFNDVCTYDGSYLGWQYTSGGSVAGINGAVDISVFKNINDKIFDHLELATPDLLEVESESTADLSNLIVYKVYTNNDREQTTDFSYNGGIITEDTKKIEISYTEDGITSTINVPVKVIAHTHEWGDWTIVKEPTEDEEGLKERTCLKNDSHKDSAVIDKLPIMQDEIIVGDDDAITSSENVSYKSSMQSLINPKTNDNIIIYLIILLSSMFGLVYSGFVLRKVN